LADADPDATGGDFDHAADLYWYFTSPDRIRGVGVAKLHKVLHVKRPGLYPILDKQDWLGARQRRIEKELAARHLGAGGIAMYDLSSSWLEGTCCELAAYGYSRDGRCWQCCQRRVVG
jgi:hypothetical protein